MNALKCVWSVILVSVSTNANKVSISITNCVNASHCDSLTTNALQSVRYAVVVVDIDSS